MYSASATLSQFPNLLGLLVHELTTLSQAIKLLEEDGERNDRSSGGNFKELEKVAKKYEKLVKNPASKKIWDRVKWALESPDLDALRNKKPSKSRSPTSPTISALSGGAFKATFITACFMTNAELQNHRWSAIGAEEWIQAGRWWLVGAQSELLANHRPGSLPAKQLYTDLIKASWILLDSWQRLDAVTSELELLESSGFTKPSFSEIETCDLNIWEGLTRAPSFQLRHSDKTSAGSDNQYRKWETAEERVLFQGDQSWIIIATSDKLIAEEKIIKLYPGDQSLAFSSGIDALYTFILWESGDSLALCIETPADSLTLQRP
ncbi:uncharacterized protein LAJ45_11336 [Morchella importuna]|uniref:uncharacterized protein n=1 Tax=Morchella importuna TaxID=1174673 RepID=UPI001E8D98F5|nr:uncharacterized protein LAJ45_11336 [Morchella importuna]KAH8144675.1 hypothetical protein LAJ45_11336 [Morchella importuna]